MTRMMFSIIPALLIAMSINARAEPDVEIHYLMNDSVSMLDWGLWKIENDLTKLRPGINGKPIPTGISKDFLTSELPAASASYSYEENLITISSGMPMLSNNSETLLKALKDKSSSYYKSLDTLTNPHEIAINMRWVLASTRNEAMEWCNSLLESIVYVLKGRREDNSSIMENYFSHTTFRRSNEPVGLGISLDKLTLIKAETTYIDSDAITLMRCERRLTSNSVRYSK